MPLEFSRAWHQASSTYLHHCRCIISYLDMLLHFLIFTSSVIHVFILFPGVLVLLLRCGCIVNILWNWQCNLFHILSKAQLPDLAYFVTHEYSLMIVEQAEIKSLSCDHSFNMLRNLLLHLLCMLVVHCPGSNLFSPIKSFLKSLKAVFSNVIV